MAINRELGDRWSIANALGSLADVALSQGDLGSARDYLREIRLDENGDVYLADSIVDARVWSGIHFRFADTEAAKIGGKVAHWGNRHAFR